METEMWTCPACQQKFVQKNQYHSCNDRTIEDFLKGKSDHIRSLFDFFVQEYQKMGDIILHPAKSRIGFAARTRFGYIHRIGREFIDGVLHFSETYDEAMCFYKIANIPGSEIYNHYFRLYEQEDLTDELKYFLRLAYDIGNKPR